MTTYAEIFMKYKYMRILSGIHMFILMKMLTSIMNKFISFSLSFKLS